MLAKKRALVAERSNYLSTAVGRAWRAAFGPDTTYDYLSVLVYGVSSIGFVFVVVSISIGARVYKWLYRQTAATKEWSKSLGPRFVIMHESGDAVTARSELGLKHRLVKASTTPFPPTQLPIFIVGSPKAVCSEKSIQ